MSKNVKIGLIVVAILIVGFFAWRWWMGRQSSIQSPTQAFGTNLNSVAPELVGGSAGPSVGSAPAVSLPVSITLTEPTSGKVDLDDDDRKPKAISAKRSEKPIHRQRHSAGVVSGPDKDIAPAEESGGERGMSDAEQDEIDNPDASAVSTPMYGTGI